MQEIIDTFLKKQNIPAGSGFIIAVSGGPDSIALLHLFQQMHLRIQALHCNFGLRGSESDRDQQFVEQFCKDYGIPLSVKKFDTRGYASENKISIEMAARELRYTWFREMLQKEKLDYIVTGHHADDQAETLLINLCRGTGIRGLVGIKPVHGFLLRPLLSCSRAQILQYLQNHRIDYRNDSTNQSLEFIRNKIRHKIIPVCKEINPSFLTTIQENCRHISEALSLYTYAIDTLKSQVTEQRGKELLIHIGKLSSAPAPATLLYEILAVYGFNKTQIHDILRSQNSIPGKRFFSENYLLNRGRLYWRLIPREEQEKTKILLEKTGDFPIHGTLFHLEITDREENFTFPSDPSVACIDADKITFPLTVRNWEKGDRFCPLGMQKQQKKVSDFFTDQKLTSTQKEECLLLTSADRIVWIIGYRLDDRFKVTTSTKRILKISLYPLSDTGKI